MTVLISFQWNVCFSSGSDGSVLRLSHSLFTNKSVSDYRKELGLDLQSVAVGNCFVFHCEILLKLRPNHLVNDFLRKLDE